ncbi:MAG: SAF domain-containing protein [Acidimicrobiia bacterium]
MLWLQPPPLLRWLAAGLLIAAAAWSEFAPESGVEITVVSRDVAAGAALGPEMVETLRMPDPGFETAAPHGVAMIDLRAGDPLLPTMVSEVSIPAGWVIIDAHLPERARPGQAAVAVVTTAGDGVQPVEFPAMVVEAGTSDAFGTETGAIAVPPEWVALAGQAVAEGRLVVGVRTTHR